MDLRIKIVFLIGVIVSLNFACQDTKTDERQTYKAVGVVKAIDTANGRITIDHEDIPGYMSAMEMTRTVPDKKLLEAVTTGDKVEFEIERTGSEVVITKIQKIGEVAKIDPGGIFKTNCAECHGESGGGTDKGISFLEGHALHHTEGEFIEQVRNGEKDEMPAFKDKLSDEEIAAVVKYVREEIQGVRADKKESHKH